MVHVCNCVSMHRHSLHHNPNNKPLSVSSTPPNQTSFVLISHGKRKGGEETRRRSCTHMDRHYPKFPTTCVSVHTHKNQASHTNRNLFFSAVILMQSLYISFLAFPLSVPYSSLIPLQLVLSLPQCERKRRSPY